MSTVRTYPKLYSPLAMVASALGIFFAGQFLGGLLVAGVPLLFGWTVEHTQTWLTTNAWAQFLFIVAVESITVWLLWMLLKRRQANFVTLGVGKLRPSHVGYAVGAFVVYMALYLVILVISAALVPGLDVEQKQELGFNMAARGKDLLPIFVSLVILPPLVEELVARGFLFGGLRSTLAFWPATLITSLLFAAAHLGASSEGLLWVAGIDTFVLSVVLCYLRERTGSLWPCIGLHAIKNGLAFCLLFNIAQYF